jgi:WD40 repeat protein
MGDGTARIWQRATGKQIARLPAGSKALEDASFSPNGQLVVTAGDDGRVRIWSRRTGRFVATYRGDGKKVYTAAFGPDSRYVVFGGAGQVAHVWNWRANQVWTLRAGQDVYAAAFTADGKDVLLGTDVAFVVSGAAATGRNHPLQLWDWRAQRTLIPAADGDNRLFGHTDRVDAVSFSRDGRYAVSAGADNTARIWDMHTRKEAGVLKGNRAPVTGAVFGADDDIVITAGQDRTLRIWDWRTATQVATYADTNDILSGLGISADGRWLTVPGYTSGEAHLYRCDICGSVPQLVQLARSRITRELTPQEQAQLLSQ